MKDSRKIAIRFFTLYFLLLASITLSGCSFLGGAVDVVLWAPKKLWSVTGDKWFTVHNEQQTDLGPRRKPVGNPQNGGPVPGFAPASQPQQQMNMGAGSPQGGNFPQPYPTLQNGGYSPSMPVTPYQNMPQVQNSNTPGYPAMPTMPAIPQAYQQNPYGAGGIGQPQQMQGMQLPDTSSDLYDPDGASADAAYARGGAGNATTKKGWKIPFLSGNYKIESKYEPLAAEYIVASKDIIQEDENPANTIKPKSVRATSMFPLEKYAPKPSVPVQKIDDKKTSNYPKLGYTPEKPENHTSGDAAAVELDKMLQEVEETQAKRDKIHGQTLENKIEKEAPAKGTEVNELQTPSPQDKTVNNEIKNNKMFRSNIVASEATSSDAAIIEQISPVKQGKKQTVVKKQEQRKGFFVSLYDKIFRPEPKKIWRRSEPPTQQVTRNSTDD